MKNQSCNTRELEKRTFENTVRETAWQIHVQEQVTTYMFGFNEHEKITLIKLSLCIHEPTAIINTIAQKLTPRPYNNKYRGVLKDIFFSPALALIHDGARVL